jgi:tartrate/fumarate subfamily iron-sulfur-dependent hydro-lyase alpha chain
LISIPDTVLRELAAVLYWKAIVHLPPDVAEALEAARHSETDAAAAEVLGTMIENSREAARRSTVICQDTGIPVFLLEVGRGVSFQGDPGEALAAGIADATSRHCLRANCVDILDRRNTGNNRGRGYPVVHFEHSARQGLEVTLLAKGSGSESRSDLAMVDPVEGPGGIRRFVLETIAAGAPRSCPPVIVGVGIGGSFESVACLSKRALARPVGCHNADRRLAEMEATLLEEVNTLGIGPMGLGGDTTALWIAVEAADTHLTLNPVSVNMSCWAHRRARAVVGEDGFRVVD